MTYSAQFSCHDSLVQHVMTAPVISPCGNGTTLPMEIFYHSVMPQRALFLGNGQNYFRWAMAVSVRSAAVAVTFLTASNRKRLCNSFSLLK
jgi:hypothetical protein